MIPLNKMPLLLIIRRRLTRHNRVLSNLLPRIQHSFLVNKILAVRVARILRVQHAAGELGPVQAGRLLGGVIAKADCEQLCAVGGTEVKRVGGVGGAEFLVLELEDLHDGLLHSGEHSFERVRLLPGGFVAVIGQVGDVERCGMLRVGGTKDVAVGVEREEVGQVTSDGGEVGDHAVVHEDMAAEDEGMRVHLSHNATAACSDVGKNAVGFGVLAQGLEVEVIDGRALGLVQCWTRAGYALNV